MPGIPIAVASDRVPSDMFDHYLRVSGEDGYRAKILAMRATPFDRTLLLDVDTYVVSELSGIFELLDRFDMALAHAPNRVTIALDDVPDAYPEFNTGVVAFRRTAVVQVVLDAWLGEYDRLQSLSPPSKDQPSFRRVAFRTPELRIATLTPEFNQRFSMAGFVNQPVRILHGEGKAAYYREIARVMNRPMDFWEHRVFAGRRLFDDSGKEIADFRKDTVRRNASVHTWRKNVYACSRRGIRAVNRFRFPLFGVLQDDHRPARDDSDA